MINSNLWFYSLNDILRYPVMSGCFSWKYFWFLLFQPSRGNGYRFWIHRYLIWFILVNSRRDQETLCGAFLLIGKFDRENFWWVTLTQAIFRGIKAFPGLIAPKTDPIVINFLRYFIVKLNPTFTPSWVSEFLIDWWFPFWLNARQHTVYFLHIGEIFNFIQSL